MELTCVECGGAFERPSMKGPAPTFCSGSCRQRMHRRRREERQGKLVTVGWRNMRSGAFHRDRGDGPGWVQVYAWSAEMASARERLGKRAG